MNNQTAIFAAIRNALAGVVAIPAGMPATAIPLDGGNVWSAVIPVNDWCNDNLYSPHLFNRDGEKAAAKKDHLKGKTVTDIQRTVIACLDDKGVMTKLDGHCRAQAWKSGELEHPECETVICVIHVLPAGETSTGVYVQTLLKHAINKAGKLTATEEKQAAQMWAGAENGFVPKSWFVTSSISKAAIDASKGADMVISQSLDVAIKTPKGISKDLMENLRIFQSAREMAESFGWEKPLPNKVKTNEAGEQVNLTTEERKADRMGKEWTKGASVAAVLLASHNLDPEAALHFWYNYAQPTTQGVSGNTQASRLWMKAYQLGSQGGQVNANTKAKFVEEATALFVEWYKEQWVVNKEAIKAEFKEHKEAKNAVDVKEKVAKAIEECGNPAEGLVRFEELKKKMEEEAMEANDDALLDAIEEGFKVVLGDGQVQQVIGGDVIEMDDIAD